MATTSAVTTTPEMTLQATIIRWRSMRSASSPAGNAAMAAPALFAAVTPAMTSGLRVRATVKSGKATATSPSPLAEIPVAHQSRQKGAPKGRRDRGASVAGGPPTDGALSGAPIICRFTRSTEANEHLPPTTRSDCAPTY